MDELNNRQMVLLTMLTAFIVSVGTGIITVAMLEEAPPTLTQTVNRVVERTIERVVTGSTTPDKRVATPASTIITKEVTVYAKEDDLIIAAVEKNQPRVVSIFSANHEVTALPLASGFIVSRDGVIATDFKKISTETGLRDSYQVMISGKEYTAKPIKSDAISKSSVGLLKISNTKVGDVFDAVTFGQQTDAKVAQSVIVMSGTGGSGVTREILAKFHYFNSDATNTPRLINTIDTATKISPENAGALVTNFDGQAIGIVITASDLTNLVIYPASRLLELITTISKEGTTTSNAEGASKVGSNLL